MTELLVADRFGHVSSAETFRKADPPKTGEAFGQWAGRDLHYLTLPGGGMLQFDLNRLSLSDFRSMRDHYQINISLTILTFMIHQLDWRIECEDKKIASKIQEHLEPTWTPLVRALSQSFWAGYSPIVLQYENTVNDPFMEISKFKDLIPEECRVNWKQVEGWAPPNSAPPKINIYDGISQVGSSHPIPVENTLWYPLLMENGDYYGRKLLKPAFPAWYFSQLIHLFANRYYERFGEPIPVGRANFEDEIPDGQGGWVSGKVAMENILTGIRNRAVAVLPSDRDPMTKDYDYSLEYLESQMRGADFERYLSRLDEEMSIGMFTPTLLFRTADVGSYNLGVGHWQMFQFLLNALAGDMKQYLDDFVIRRLKDFNFSPNAPDAKIIFRKLGKADIEILKVMASQIIQQGARPDLEELSSAVGMKFTQAKVLTEPPANPNDPRSGRPERPGRTSTTDGKVANSLRPWVEAAFSAGSLHNLVSLPDVPEEMRPWLADVAELGVDHFDGPEDFLELVGRAADAA